MQSLPARLVKFRRVFRPTLDECAAGCEHASMAMRVPLSSMMCISLCVVVLAGCATGPTTFRVVSFGTYAVELEQTDARPNKQFRPITSAQLKEQTSRIEADFGTCFGAVFVFDGVVQDQPVKYRLMWRGPGAKYEEDNYTRVGRENPTGIFFDKDYPVVAGEYLLVIWQGGKEKYRREFEVIKSKRDQE